MSRFRKKKAETPSLADMVALDQTSAYEALQLHKSKISRLRVAAKYDEALSLTAQAAKLHLQQKYENSGNELGSLFVDILSESKQPITPENRNLINEIANAFESVPCLGVSFLRECVALSKSLGPRLLGDTLLHKQLGMKLWRVKESVNHNYEKDKSKDNDKDKKSAEEVGQDEGYKSDAVLHFALGESPEALWLQILEEPHMDPVLAPWTGEAKREQTTLLGVLSFLALENLRDAHILFRMLKKYRQDKQITQQQSLTYEFMDRLLLTSVRDARQLFQQLVTAYHPQLTFHPVVLQLLEGPIAKKIFGIQAPPNLMSMIANMFGG